ncbi:histidine-rich glycoprotein-like [Ostrinia furnacalis]|uniref:histidine-rich glycoprotein-like n=1 Tax=Ostrinia furnacalis TaxID=93504 RepID=UPI00103B5D9F|nr:histidine-rich glycoprotein-like [Ostrinia furnacalis]
MFIKVVAVLALAAVCLAEEHAYSSQSIVHHHVHHEHHEPKVEVKVEKQVVEKVVPVAHYVESHKHEEHKHEEHKHVEHKHEEHKHKEHKPAISSYHIERHDVPAPPPKDFHKYDFYNKTRIMYYRN